MSESKKSTAQNLEAEEKIPILDFLEANRVKLEILLSGDKKASPLLNRIIGKRKTRTIFLAESLQFIMNEYCIKHEIQIADFCEAAIIQYLTTHGYENELKDILSISAPAKDANSQL